MKQGWARAHLVYQAVTAKLRHHQVGNHQIRWFGKRSLQRLRTIGGRHDTVLVAEHLGDETLHFAIIFDHQNLRAVR
ncbi:hypothetical protein D3C84_21590 [compost metagenome]